MPRRICLLLLLSALITTALAYVRGVNLAGSLLRRTDTDNIRFLVNNQIEAGAMNSQGRVMITADSDPMAAFQAAADGWNQVSSVEITFAAVETTALLNDPQDFNHVIVFNDDPAVQSAVGGALAITRTASFQDGRVADTDILFNADLISNGQHLPFSTTLAPGTIDLGSVAIHELGHALGADHSGVIGATMFWSIPPATDVHATLSEDDVAFAREVYPAPDVAAQLGSIAGTISLGGGGSANGVLVTAVDPATGVIVSTISDFDDGSYRIGPLPPGSYLVSAEPVNGPLNPENVRSFDPGGFSTNVHNGFFGGNSDPQQVAVAAGAQSTADFAIELGPPPLEIERLGRSGVGAVGSFSRFGSNALVLQAAESLDLVLSGEGIDNTITADHVRLLGPGLSLRPGGVTIDPFVNDFPLLRVTVDVAEAAQIPGRPLATIAILKDGQAAVYSGGLVIEGAAAGPMFTAAGLAHSASFIAGPVAPEEIVTLFGVNLAAQSADATLPLPTELGGVTVEVTDSLGATRPALLLNVRPGQINFLIPAGTAAGAATLTVRTGGLSGSAGIQVETLAPGLYSANSSGQGVAAAFVLRVDANLNQTLSLVYDEMQFPFLPRPIDLGPDSDQVFLILFGTGFRQMQCGAPGVPCAGRVDVLIDGQPADVIFAGAQGGFDGLDQANVRISRDLIGRGEVSVVMAADGKQTNTLTINIQ